MTENDLAGCMKGTSPESAVWVQGAFVSCFRSGKCGQMLRKSHKAEFSIEKGLASRWPRSDPAKSLRRDQDFRGH